jgi:acylphosphatase
MLRARLVIRGRVQGVWFRASTYNRACELGVTGWVRNCPDGSVEVMAGGAKERVQQLIIWCHQGPEGALVTDVEVEWQTYQGEFREFFIR